MRIVPLILSMVILPGSVSFTTDTKVNGNLNEIGYAIDSTKSPESLVAMYTLNKKQYLLPFSFVEDENVQFRAPKTAVYNIVDNAKKFNDTSAQAITFVAARNVMNGTGDDTFSPNDYLTNAMLAQILVNLEQIELPSAKEWYTPAIDWAKSFLHDTKPNEPITRQNFAAALYNYANSKKFELWQKGLMVARPPFADMNDITEYAQEAVTKLNWGGILSVKTDNKFMPNDLITRSEAANILQAFITRITKVN